MMIQSLLICVLAVATATASPQFVTFKDGKIGVNFAGYNAEAGLGGLLTGNAAHGGLSASAGTPFGQRAAAGLDGSVNGAAGGRAYAGAQASDSIGASAILGGNTGSNQRGIIGAEAHSNGNSVTKTITSRGGAPDNTEELVVPTDLPKDSGVQKIKPPKKYNAVESRFGGDDTVATKKVRTVYKTVNAQPTLVRNSEETQDGYQTVEKNVQVTPGSLNQWFNIPIGILTSIRDNLSPLSVRKQVTYTSSA